MNVFLNEPIHRDAYNILQENFHIIDDFNEINQCEIVITRNHHIDKEFIDKCPSLQLIAVHGTGYDDVDIEYAKKKNIHLIHTPKQNSLSVAELNVALMLDISRKIYLLNSDKKQNIIKSVAPVEYLGCEVSYKTAGFIGLGQIAKDTIQILKYGFHMNIIAYSPSLNTDTANKMGIHCASVDDIFKTCDYIFICCPLNKDTYHMIHKSHFQNMKPSAFIINTARGAILNEDDLYKALREKKIAGAALDVIENEPVHFDHPLLTLNNVIYTSHMGASTDEALRRVGICLINGILDYSQHKTPQHFVF